MSGSAYTAKVFFNGKQECRCQEKVVDGKGNRAIMSIFSRTRTRVSAYFEDKGECCKLGNLQVDCFFTNDKKLLCVYLNKK